MSEQNATPNSGNQTPGNPPEEQKPRVYTEADIREMRLAGDHEGVKRAVEQLQRKAQGQEPLPEEQKPDAGAAPESSGEKPDEQKPAGEQPQPQQQQDDGKEKKTFDIRFRGVPRSYTDEDGYLGAGDFGKMKKELAHARAMIEDYELRYSERSTETEGALQKARALTEQLEAAQARVKELEAENKNLASAPQATAQKPQGQGDAPAAEIPDPPARPDIPEDPFEWTPEQKEAHNAYRKSRDEYDRKITDILRRSMSKPTSQTPPSQPPAQKPAAQETGAELPPDVKEAVEYFRRKKEQDAASNAAASQKAYWDNFREFQKLHSEYATPVDIEEMNRQVASWMNRLAWANGYELKPGATPEQRAQYETTKKQLAYRYMQKDPLVVQNAEACPPPQGYEAYSKLATISKTLNTFKQELIKRGTLAQNATMHDVWLHYYSQNEMGDDIQRMEAEAAGRGANQVMSAMEKHQRQDAVNLPNNLSAGGGAQGQSSGDFSPEEVQRLLTLSPIEMARNPELVEKRKKLMSQLAAG